MHKDALDTIRIYQGNDLIAKWRECDDPVQANVVLNSENDTLTFWCSTDVGWIDSTSLFLTVQGIQRNDLYLSPFVDSNVLRTHFFLPTHRISNDIESIEVWRQSDKYKKLIFQLSLQRKDQSSPYCSCLDSVYVLKKDYLNHIGQINRNEPTNDQTKYDDLLVIREKINQAEITCSELKSSSQDECLIKTKIDALNDDIELIHRVIEMNPRPRGCTEIERPKE